MEARMAALARQFESIKAASEAALLMIAEGDAGAAGCRHSQREVVSGFGETLTELCRDCGRMLRDGQEVVSGG